MLKANTILRDPVTPVNSLVTDVLAQEPPIDQSPNTALIPVIFVSYSKNPIGHTTQIGRDSLNSAGAKYYHIEFYNVCIVRGISRQNAMAKVEQISSIVRDVYQKNLRMTSPATGLSPICATNEVVAVPYVLRSDDPNIQSINVIVRPEVPIQLV